MSNNQESGDCLANALKIGSYVNIFIPGVDQHKDIVILGVWIPLHDRATDFSKHRQASDAWFPSRLPKGL